MRAAVIGVLASLSVACGSAGVASPSHSPTADPFAARYVALIHAYWIELRAADQATATSNVVALVCLGNRSRTSPTDLANVDPARCAERATAILAVHQKFLTDLESTAAPSRFAGDDRVLRETLPKGVEAVKAMIAACATGSKESVLAAARFYAAVMIPAVTSALDDIDPTVIHD